MSEEEEKKVSNDIYGCLRDVRGAGLG